MKKLTQQLFLFAGMLFLVAGCQTTPLTPEEERYLGSRDAGDGS